jgi:pSer/pThr/pTyr-binding forkhead associated (FHA) protein
VQAGGSLERPLFPQATVAAGSEEAGAVAVEPSGYRVWTVRRTGRSTFPRVTVGRARNNDVIVPDASVSKFHAFIGQSGNEFFIQDAGSRNGTVVAGVSAPARGRGDPLPLEPGAVVRFGSVEMVFLRTAEFLRLLRTVLQSR